MADDGTVISCLRTASASRGEPRVLIDQQTGLPSVLSTVCFTDDGPSVGGFFSRVLLQRINTATATVGGRGVAAPVRVEAYDGVLKTDDEKRGTVPRPKICDVTAHGARGDNSTDDTDAFDAAIAACSGAAPTGRGVVLAPAPGRYLLKPLELKDNVELQIRPGATLVLWPFGASYPNYTAAHVRPSGQIPEAGCFNNPAGAFTCGPPVCRQSALQIPKSFLWGENVSNVVIGGGGTIDGQGLAWWLNSWWKRPDLNMYWRPKLLEFPGASDLTLGGPQGLRLLNSPMWNTALHRNTRLRVSNVTVHSPSEWINTDGINFSGEDIHVADCTVFNGDDCVPVFAASGPRGTRNVLVERVACHGGTNAGIVSTPGRHPPSPDSSQSATANACSEHRRASGVWSARTWLSTTPSVRSMHGARANTTVPFSFRRL